MILVIAGTKDGRELALRIAENGYRVLVSVVSRYGGELVRQENLAVHTGALDAEGLADLIRQHGIKAVVDASHPYAANVSRNTLTACEQCGIKYLRYERPAVPLPVYDRLYVAADAAEAARLAANLGKVVFLTTGSRTLGVFKQAPALAGHRLIARVLPDLEVLQECLSLGFSPADIVAVQGPFSHALNVALFSEFGAEVVVTKNSGEVGGSDSKFSAAMELGLPIVVIDRPTVSYQYVVSDSEAVIAFIKEALA
jgi:precorrin-6A/cobalt-precorrin-6A reductase